MDLKCFGTKTGIFWHLKKIHYIDGYFGVNRFGQTRGIKWAVQSDFLAKKEQLSNL